MGFRNCEARFCAITDEHSVAYLLLIFLIVLQFLKTEEKKYNYTPFYLKSTKCLNILFTLVCDKRNIQIFTILLKNVKL